MQLHLTEPSRLHLLLSHLCQDLLAANHPLLQLRLDLGAGHTLEALQFALQPEAETEFILEHQYRATGETDGGKRERERGRERERERETQTDRQTDRQVVSFSPIGIAGKLCLHFIDISDLLVVATVLCLRIAFDCVNLIPIDLDDFHHEHEYVTSLPGEEARSVATKG